MSHTSISPVTDIQKPYFNDNNYYTEDTQIPQKKKASRACLHCQKAHLTCDDARPCQRCVKRNLANTCTDAVRKKAKYLHDTDELYQGFTHSIPENTTASIANMDASQLFDFSLNDLGFGSETIGLEYGFIGNMLQNPLDLTLNGGTVTHQQSPMTTSPLSNFNATDNFQQQQQQQQQQQIMTTSPKQSSFYMKRANSLSNGRRKGVGNTPDEVYASVKKPFNYAEGFHYLIQYFKERMGKDDLMRISRAMALFRPSSLSLIINLTEEDLVFMEKCVQRTLLEYEKLISFSGTPCVTWRRTGEICLVGKEFSLLTLWTKDMLLGKKTYIYELMDSQSAVEYWEKFSTHAFDNANKSCIYSCILLTPQQKPVPCSFCFTIKRDIFDLPSVIVGNLFEKIVEE
ncbi:hypothetical protein K501DRAFT_336329 [Backusella circina FSU 941]|nr:hypothetical protein K501DRAFT_336329 [Backusella circina FSU 941]